MAFDAGTIMARLDLDDSAFARKLDADVARIEAFERGDHEIRIGVGPDQQGFARTRDSVRRLDQQITQDAHRRGGLLSFLSGGARGVLGAAGPGLNTGVASRLVSTRTGLIAGGAGIGLGALPTLVASLLGGGVGLLGAGVAGLGAKALIGSKADPGQLYNPAQALMAQMKKTITAGAEPLIAPLKRVFAELSGPGGILANLERPLRQMFSGAATLIQPLVHGLTDLAQMILPGLGRAFRAAAPLLQPLIDGIGMLVRGILPGLTTLLRAAHPAIVAFSGVLGTLGSGIGKMLRAFAPAIKSSAIIFKALGDILAAIFPIIGKLAGVFARELGPVFVQLVKVVERLLPFLRPIGDLLAKLAGAVLRDLVALLRPLANLLVAIAPSLTVLAKALGQAFDVLENSGLFGVLANALERIVPVLAKFVNDLVKHLAPYLPVLIQAFTDFLGIMVQLTEYGLIGVIKALDWMVNHIPGLVPILVSAWLAWEAWKTISPIVKGVGGAFKWLTSESTINAAKQIGNAILVAAKWVWQSAVAVAQFAIQAAAATAAFIAENAATLGIIAGIVLLVGAIIFLATHWGRVWGDIKNWAKDAWDFLTHGWGQWLVPGLTLIRLAIGFVRDHWKQAWNDIKGAALDAWHFLHDDVFAPIANFITQTLPNAFKTGVSAIGDAWKALGNVTRAPVAWVVDHVIDGLISAFDWISGKVGGPHIPAIHPFGLARGGHIPGYGGGDRHPALLEGGETVVSKESSGLPFMRAAFMAAGVPGYIGGGIVPPGQKPHGGGGGWNPFTAIGHAVTGGLHMLAGGGKIMAALATGNTTALINAVTGMIPGGVGGAVGDMAGLLLSVPKTLIKDAVHFLIHTASAAFGSPFTGHYGAGVAQWRGDVLRALAMEHLPAMLASRVLFQMQTESGGNPNAINLNDSNAAAGDPSRGLLQTIMSTFRAYHWPGTSFDIYNPLANIAAAINYAVHTYGPSLMSGGRGMGSGHGYDSGGWMIGGLNRTGRPEAVLTPGQSRAFVALSEAAERLGAGRGGAAGGGMMRDLYLTLPEGATIADALAEIGFRLQVSAQRGYTGVLGG